MLARNQHTTYIYIYGGINESVIKNVSTLGNKAAIWGGKNPKQSNNKTPIKLQ